MPDDKDKLLLLKQLQQLGVHASGRKVRSDTGKSHAACPTRRPRSDKGQKRENYTVSPAVLQRIFNSALAGTAIRNERGEVVGEGATRDENGVFDLRVSAKWKSVTRANGQSYKYRLNKSHHLEQLRWEWLSSLDDKSMFIKHYHLDPDEAEQGVWTFSEWAVAYMDTCGGAYLPADEHIRYYDNAGKPIMYENKYKLFKE